MDFEKIIIEKYKCFNNVEISGIKNINIVIGKNNIGKSSILDVIEMIYGVKKSNNSKILLTKRMDENLISSVFRKGYGGGGINGDHYEFGKQYIDKELTFVRKNDGINASVDDFEKYNNHLPSQQISYWTSCSSSIK